MIPSSSAALRLWQAIASKPFGKLFFSLVVAHKAPYFSTIAPRFEALAPGHCRVRMRKRRAVHNHIGTVHAIALCNLAELVAGVCTDVSVPKGIRWLPKSMNVEYLAKANSDVTGECQIPPIIWSDTMQMQDLVVEVHVKDRSDTLVCRARITMYLTRKPQ
jgi:uncharacterized protein (TIGR00369 family)